MKALIEIMKEDPAETIGALVSFSGLGFIVFMLFIIC